MLLFTLAISACSTPQSHPGKGQSIEEQLNHRFHSLVEAAETLNHAAYFSHFDAQRFTALNTNGTVSHSFETFQRDYLAGVETIQAYQHLNFKNVKLTVIDDDHAVLVNEYTSTIQLKNGSVLHFAGAGTQVWHKTKGQWLLVNVSSSSAADSST